LFFCNKKALPGGGLDFGERRTSPYIDVIERVPLRWCGSSALLQRMRPLAEEGFFSQWIKWRVSVASYSPEPAKMFLGSWS